VNNKIDKIEYLPQSLIATAMRDLGYAVRTMKNNL
jgi:hypothetical protein